MSEPSLARQYLERFVAATGGVRAADGGVLPAGSAQRRFVIAAESTGQRMLVPYAYTLRTESLELDEVRRRAVYLVHRHPALQCRVDYDDAGLITQRRVADTAPPCTVSTVADAEEETATLRRLLTDAAGAVEPCPLRIALLRGRHHDRLVLLFDHAVTDETSLRLVTRDLFSAEAAQGAPAGDGHWADYRRAVWRWLDTEVAAATDEAIAYWVSRHASVAAAQPVAVSGTATFPGGTDGEPVLVDSSPVPVPSPQVRATLFPRLLAASHRALQQADAVPSSVIYPWGARPASVGDVVGCFMNTVFSGDTPESGISAQERWTTFASACWRDFDFANVPFDDVVLAVNRLTRSGWSGTARCLLGLEDIAGRAPVGPVRWGVREWLPSWLIPKCPVNTTVRYDSGSLALRVVADPVEFPAATDFMAVWRECVVEQLCY